MFDILVIASRIVELRKEKGLTQMELADQLNVSHQAISNWERGSTAPDISKLPELAKIFGVSIDFILGEGEATDIIKRAADENSELEDEQELTTEAFANAAPVLKPEQASKLSDRVSRLDDLDKMIDSLPYLSTQTAERVSEKAIETDNQRLLELIPFVNKETADRLAHKAIELKADPNKMIDCIPFVSIHVANAIAQYCSAAGIARAPDFMRYVDDGAADNLARELLAQRAPEERLAEALPGVSEEMAHSIIDELLKRGCTRKGSIVSFASQEQACEIARRGIMRRERDKLMVLMPYVTPEVADQIVRNSIDLGTKRVTPYIPYAAAETATVLVERAIARRDSMVKLMDALSYVPEETADKIAYEALSRNLGTIEEFAPYISKKCMNTFIGVRYCGVAYNTGSVFGNLFVRQEQNYIPDTEKTTAYMKEQIARGAYYDGMMASLPFVDRETACAMAMLAMNTGCERLYIFIPYVDRETADKLIDRIIVLRKNEGKLFRVMPLLSTASADKVARQMVKSGNDESYGNYARSISDECRKDLVKNIINEHWKKQYSGRSRQGRYNNHENWNNFPFNTDRINNMVNRLGNMGNMAGNMSQVKDIFVDMRKEIVNDIRDEVEDEVRDELRGEMEQQIREQMKEQLKKEFFHNYQKDKE